LFISHHITPGVVDLLSTARVRMVLVTFAPQPHTTQIFQVLDLTLSRVLKRPGQYQLLLIDDAGSVRLMKKMYHDHDFQMTITGPNIWGAFQRIGVNYSVVDGV
jgi:hypothetical protein